MSEINPISPVYSLQLSTIAKVTKEVFGDREITITDVFTVYDKNGIIKTVKMTNSQIDIIV
jgi:hypothetical protein